jgi:hypothetical protein
MYEDDDALDWKTTRVDKSRPPLRWIANLAGSIASSGILKVSYMEEENKTNIFKYKYYGWLWDTFWPIYEKYGTFYEVKVDREEE